MRAHLMNKLLAYLSSSGSIHQGALQFLGPMCLVNIFYSDRICKPMLSLHVIPLAYIISICWTKGREGSVGSN